MNNKVIILFPNPFPVGGSSTNRVTHIAKAIKKSFFSLNLIITFPQIRQSNKLGGSEIKYISSYPIKSKKGKIYMLLPYMFTYLKTIHFLLFKKYDFVLSYADYSLFNHIVYFLIIKVIKRKKMIYVVDEYPWIEIYPNKYLKIYKAIYARVYFKLFDGLIVMTKTLEKYYSKKISRNAKIFHFPMSVEIERFQRFNKVVLNQKKYRVVYCGGGGISDNNKDGLDILIESFSEFNNQYPDSELILIGRVDEKYVSMIKEYNLDSCIVLKGWINSNEIPLNISKADLLILSRISSFQNQGAFPSKLGEYLATGIPVLVTRTGEISYYLKDNESAFLAKPNSVEGIVEKLIYAYENKEISKKIGLRGLDVAKKNFNYKLYSKPLVDFLHSIK